MLLCSKTAKCPSQSFLDRNNVIKIGVFIRNSKIKSYLAIRRRNDILRAILMRLRTTARQLQIKID
jgi:hypothetical protein